MTDTIGLRSATRLLAALRHREVGSEELLDHYLARIETLNPAINAVVTFDVERARDRCRAADAATARGESWGALHGLPITIKDALATEGIRSTGGARELSDFVPDYDASVVAALKDAGAVVFAKTNLPRWSGDAQSYNELFGVTNNPWDTARTPGGSSGGASAAVAAGLSAFDIGTDIGGSVRLPAHFAGVFGHKPSWGLVPGFGYLDHPTGGTQEVDVNVHGPLARSADDLDLIMGVISGPAPDKAAAFKVELPAPRHVGLADYRVAVWSDDPACPVDAEIVAGIDAVADALEGAGATVDRAARPDLDWEECRRRAMELISVATTTGWSDEAFEKLSRTAWNPDGTKPAETVERARIQAMFHRDWTLLGEERRRVRDVWAEFFTRFDALLCPVTVSPAFEHVHEGHMFSRTLPVNGVTRAYYDVMGWTCFIGWAYLPVSVPPIGVSSAGLPFGVQVVGPYMEDRTTIALARSIEALVGGYQVPPMAR